MTGRIAVLGSIMADLTTYVAQMPARGETVDALRFSVAQGGKGANQAVAAARLGSTVMLVACVGADAFGAAARSSADACGIATSHVRTVADAATGVATILVEPSGDNRILIVRGANEAMGLADLGAAAEDLSTYDTLLLQLEVPLEVVYAAIAFGAERGLRVILNPAPAVALDFRYLRGLAYLIPNEHELSMLTGREIRDHAAARDAARELLAYGIACVIVTLGADGALLVEATRERHVPGVTVAAIDTTGAGDAFIGSFAHVLSATGDVDAALETAVRYAADSVTRRGTQTAYASALEFAVAGHEAAPR